MHYKYIFIYTRTVQYMLLFFSQYFFCIATIYWHRSVNHAQCTHIDLKVIFLLPYKMCWHDFYSGNLCSCDQDQQSWPRIPDLKKQIWFVPGTSAVPLIRTRILAKWFGSSSRQIICGSGAMLNALTLLISVLSQYSDTDWNLLKAWSLQPQNYKMTE